MKDDHLFIIATRRIRRKKADINDPDVQGFFCGKHDLVSYEEKGEEAKEAHKLTQNAIEDTSSSFFKVTFIVSMMNLEVTIITPVCSITVGNKPIVITILSTPTDKTDCMTPIQSSGF